jgi:hypothetical protein
MKRFYGILFLVILMASAFYKPETVFAGDTCTYTVKPWNGSGTFSVNYTGSSSDCKSMESSLKGGFNHLYSKSLFEEIFQRQVKKPSAFAGIRAGSRLVSKISFELNGKKTSRLWIAKAHGWTQCSREEPDECVLEVGSNSKIQYFNTRAQCNYDRTVNARRTDWGNTDTSCTLQFASYGYRTYTDFKNNIDVQRPANGEVLATTDIVGFRRNTGQVGVRAFNLTSETSSVVAFYKLDKITYVEPDESYCDDDGDIYDTYDERLCNGYSESTPIQGFIRRGLGKFKAGKILQRPFYFNIPEISGHSYDILVTVQTHMYNSITNRWNVVEMSYFMNGGNPQPQSFNSASYPAEGISSGSGLSVQQINRTVRLIKGGN